MSNENIIERNLVGKKLLILGGISHMIDVVITAKKMGIYTIVTDYDEESPAKKVADKSYTISTTDIDALEEIAKKEKVDGIFTGFEDTNTYSALEVCNRLKLPFYSNKEQLDTASNKVKFKEICKEYNLPVVETYDVKELEKGGLRKLNLKYPVIVKPVDSYGSKGITVCQKESDLSEAISKAKKFSKTKTYVIERFYTGHGVEINYTIQNGNIFLTAMSDRYVYKQHEQGAPLPIAIVYPSNYLTKYAEKMDSLAKDMINGMNIKNGVVAFQAVVEKSNIYLYEMAFRLTGEKHYQLVKKESGIDLLKMMIELSLTGSCDLHRIEKNQVKEFKFPACNLSLLVRPGTVTKIKGVKNVSQMSEVIDITQLLYEDDIVSTVGDYNQMFARINIVASNAVHLFEVIDTINNTIKVLDEQGENMLVSPFTKEISEE